MSQTKTRVKFALNCKFHPGFFVTGNRNLRTALKERVYTKWC